MPLMFFYPLCMSRSIINSDDPHVLSLLDMEEVFALHGLLQQGSVLQHQGLDLVQQVSVLLLQIPFQLAQQLHTEERRF